MFTVLFDECNVFVGGDAISIREHLCYQVVLSFKIGWEWDEQTQLNQNGF